MQSWIFFIITTSSLSDCCIDCISFSDCLFLALSYLLYSPLPPGRYKAWGHMNAAAASSALDATREPFRYDLVNVARECIAQLSGMPVREANFRFAFNLTAKHKKILGLADDIFTIFARNITKTEHSFFREASLFSDIWHVCRRIYPDALSQRRPRSISRRQSKSPLRRSTPN